MIYKSLTDVPHDLKQGIDWLIAVRGDDAEYNLAALGAAVHKFLADKPVGKMEVPALEWVKRFTKLFLKKPEIISLPFAKEMLGRLDKPMNKSHKRLATGGISVEESDHKNIVRTWNVKPGKIAKNIAKLVDGCEKFLDKIKLPDQYESSYSSEATWDASCAKDPEACAVVLVGIAPMLYTGLRSVSDAARLAYADGPNSDEEVRMHAMFDALGYEEPQRRPKLSGKYVRTTLKDVPKDLLDILYDLAGFWAFY